MSKRKRVKFRRTITGIRVARNTAGSLLAELKLSCGHVARRPARRAQIRGGGFYFGADSLPCRECRQAGRRS